VLVEELIEKSTRNARLKEQKEAKLLEDKLKSDKER